jgi:DNA integrity scanning protein DisA with diadenylate cyclase activity
MNKIHKNESTMAAEQQIFHKEKSIEEINAAMIKYACAIAYEIGADKVLAYVNDINSRSNLESMLEESQCILAARDQKIIETLKEMHGQEDRVIQVPNVNLTRLSQVKVAAMVALSKGLIQHQDRIVCLSGSPRYGVFDNLSVIDVSREFEIFTSTGLEIAQQVEKPHVFNRLLTLVLELAKEGKEGKPLGAIFILGDHARVMEMSSKMIINPFAGVPENECNILDPDLKETLREFASIDGAFVVRDDGVVLAAGRHLKTSIENEELPQGLGARHRAAAGITALTDSIAFVISESTGDVRIFNKGRIFMEIEKSKKEP